MHCWPFWNTPPIANRVFPRKTSHLHMLQDLILFIGPHSGITRRIVVFCVLSAFMIGHSLIRCAKSCFEAEVDLTMSSDTSTPILSRRYCDLHCICNKHNFNSGACRGTLRDPQEGKQVPSRLSPSVCGPLEQLTLFQVPLSCSGTEICPYPQEPLKDV